MFALHRTGGWQGFKLTWFTVLFYLEIWIWKASAINVRNYGSGVEFEFGIRVLRCLVSVYRLSASHHL